MGDVPESDLPDIVQRIVWQSNADRILDAMARKMDQIQRASTEAAQRIDKTSGSVDDLGDSAKGTSRELGGLADGAQKAGREIEQTGDKAQSAGRLVDRFGAQIEQTGRKAKAAGRDVDDLGDSARGTGESAVAAGKGVSSFGDQAERAGRKAESASRDVDDLGDEMVQTAAKAEIAGAAVDGFGGKAKRAGHAGTDSSGGVRRLTDAVKDNGKHSKSAGDRLEHFIGRLQVAGGMSNMASASLGMLKAPALIGALPVAVSGIEALAGSVVALGSAIAPVSGLIGAMPGLFGLVAQGAGTVMLAFGGLSDAFKAGDKAASGGAKEAKAYKEALDKLDPAAANFVRTASGFKPVLEEVRKSAQAGLFPGVETALVKIVRLAPTVSKGLYETGKSLGGAADQIASWASTPEVMERIDKIMGGNARTMRSLGPIVSNLGDALLHVMSAAQPLVDEIVQLAVRGSEWARTAARAGDESGRMSAFFERAFDTARQLGRILENVTSMIHSVGKASSESGKTMLDSIESFTAKWGAALKATEGQNKLKTFFAESSPVVKELVGLVGDLGKVLSQGSGQSVVLDILQRLRAEGIPIIDKIMHGVSGGFMDKLLDVGFQAAQLFAEMFGESGPMNTFVDTLSQILKVIQWLVKEVPGFKQFVFLVGTLGAAAKAFRVAGVVTGLGKIGSAAKVASSDGLAPAVKQLLGFKAAAEGAGKAASAGKALAGVGAAAAGAATGVQAAGSALGAVEKAAVGAIPEIAGVAAVNAQAMETAGAAGVQFSNMASHVEKSGGAMSKVKGIFSSTNLLLAGAALAAGGALYAYQNWRAEQQKIAAQSKALGQALGAEGDMFKNVGEQVKQYLVDRKQIDDINRMGVTVDQYTQAMLGSAAAMDTYRKAALDAGEVTLKMWDQATRSFVAADEASKNAWISGRKAMIMGKDLIPDATSLSAGDLMLDGNTGIINRMDEQRKGARDETLKRSKEMIASGKLDKGQWFDWMMQAGGVSSDGANTDWGALAKHLNDLEGAAASAKVSAEQLAEARRREEEATRNATAAVEGHRRAVQDEADATAALSSGPFAEHQKAYDKLAAAQDKYTKAMEGGHTSKKKLAKLDAEVKAAQDEVNASVRAASDDADTYVSSVIRTAEETAKMSGKTMSAEQSTRMQMKAYADLAMKLSPNDPLRKSLLDYITELDSASGIREMQLLLGLDPESANRQLAAFSADAEVRFATLLGKFNAAMRIGVQTESVSTHDKSGNVSVFKRNADGSYARDAGGNLVPASHAAGGRIETLAGAGFATASPTLLPGGPGQPDVLVGEGSRVHEEFVIPTDPQYRSRALELFEALGRRLGGATRMAKGGVIDRRGATDRSPGGGAAMFGTWPFEIAGLPFADLRKREDEASRLIASIRGITEMVSSGSNMTTIIEKMGEAWELSGLVTGPQGILDRLARSAISMTEHGDRDHAIGWIDHWREVAEQAHGLIASTEAKAAKGSTSETQVAGVRQARGAAGAIADAANAGDFGRVRELITMGDRGLAMAGLGGDARVQQTRQAVLDAVDRRDLTAAAKAGVDYQSAIRAASPAADFTAGTDATPTWAASGTDVWGNIERRRSDMMGGLAPLPRVGATVESWTASPDLAAEDASSAPAGPASGSEVPWQAIVSALEQLAASGGRGGPVVQIDEATFNDPVDVETLMQRTGALLAARRV